MKEKGLLKEIGKRINARRKELRITQAQLSRSCSTDPSYIRKIEAGKVNISIVRLKDLLEALDVSLADFLTDL